MGPATLEGLAVKSRVGAGLVLYRKRDGQVEILLAHPGGPFFAHKDAGHWTIPKGEVETGEDMLATAIREMQEETGIAIGKTQTFIELGSIRQKGGKIVHAWATEYIGPEPSVCTSNVFHMEWPIGSGRMQAFPEVDRAEFFPLELAKIKIKASQVPLLERLGEKERGSGGT